MWSLPNNNFLDPTNKDGLLDLELSYFFNLIKVNTILARINEPSVGKDVNVITRVEGSDVIFVTERDISANGKLIQDYV